MKRARRKIGRQRSSSAKGVITIAFDDAYLDTCRYAIGYLNRLNVRSTVAAPSSLVGKRFENRTLAGAKQLKEAVASGHEIASHSSTHPNLLKLSVKDKDAALGEISGSKKELQKVLKKNVRSFVFPYIHGNQSGALRLKTKPFYASSRITHDRPCFNKLPLVDSHSIAGFSVMKKHSVSYLNGLADIAEKKRLWLVEVFHLVARKNTQSASRPAPYRFFTHIDDFKEHIRYVLSKDVLILTQHEAVKRFGNGL